MTTLAIEGVYPIAFEAFADIAEVLLRFIHDLPNAKRLYWHSATSAPLSSRTNTLGTQSS